MTGISGSWWDFDEGEKPVPLIADAEAVLGAANEAVDAAREAICREVTEPVRIPDPGSRDMSVVAVGLLLIGCVAMFVIGWWHGVSAQLTVGTGGAEPGPVAVATLEPPLLISSNGFEPVHEEALRPQKEEA